MNVLQRGLAAAFNDGVHWDFVVQVRDVEFKDLQNGLLQFVVGKNEEIQTLPELPAFFEQHPPIALAIFRALADNRNILKEMSKLQKEMIELQTQRWEHFDHEL
ncbi:hypothetical protein M3Y99_00645900 [Aphelenchoides fujianensis]|nr:hypothetical protein M3Y99_00645900 [Aphelenchoides fujianensis]